MKFKITHENSTHENESDYETAVDVSHSSISDVSYSLKTLSGLEVALSYTNIETSYSYYEENIPDNFKAGDQLQYNHQSDPNKHDSSTYGHIQATLNEKLVILTKEEFIEYFNNYMPKSEAEKCSIGWTDDSTQLNKKFYKFQEQQSGYKDYNSIVHIGGKEEAKAFMEKIQDHKKNIWFDIEVPESLKTVIAELEKKNEEINAHNSSHLIEIMCTQANARLSIIVEKLTHEAKIELGLEAKQVKLKM